MNNNVVKAKEALKILGISYATLNRWTKKGYLPHFMTPSGHFRYRREDLEAFAQKYAGQLKGDYK